MKFANDSNFEETICKEKLTLVDFFATWCMPCKMQSEVLEKLEKSRSLAFDIVKINVDDSPNLASRFEISSIPTLVVMKDGKVLKKSVGLSEENELVDMMSEFENS